MVLSVETTADYDNLLAPITAITRRFLATGQGIHVFPGDQRVSDSLYACVTRALVINFPATASNLQQSLTWGVIT